MTIIGFFILIFILGAIGVIFEGIIEGVSNFSSTTWIIIFSFISIFCFWNLINHIDFFYFLLRKNGEINWLGIILSSLVFIIPVVIFLITESKLISLMPVLIIFLWFINVTGLLLAINKQINRPSNTKILAINDLYFEASLVRKQIDDKIDGEINLHDVFDIEELDLSGDSSTILITSLDGIEEFEYLKTLHVDSKQLKYLDLSKNDHLENLSINAPQLEILILPSSLKHLKCENSRLKNLDLSNSHRLVDVELKNNLLERLDLPKKSNRSHLEYLNCSMNKLNTLDLSTSPLLKDLNCEDNLIELIEFCQIDGHVRIYEIDCSKNQLTFLKLPKGVRKVNCADNKLKEIIVPSSIITLDCFNNELPSLDLSEAIDLSSVNCLNNRLSSLNIDNNPKITEVNIRQNNISEINVIRSLELKDIYYDMDRTKVLFDKSINQKLNI